MLAVKAIKQGKAAVASIAGEKTEVDLTFMPVVAHTIPPIVSVGLTEQSARDFGLAIRVSQFALVATVMQQLLVKRMGLLKLFLMQQLKSFKAFI